MTRGWRWVVAGLIGTVTLALIFGVLTMRRTDEPVVTEGDVTVDDVLNLMVSNSGQELRSRGITVEKCTKRIQRAKDQDTLVGCRVSGSAELLNAWIASRAFAFGPRVVNRLPPAFDLIEVGGPFPAHELYGDASPEGSFSVGTVVVVNATHTSAIVYDRSLLIID